MENIIKNILESSNNIVEESLSVIKFLSHNNQFLEIADKTKEEKKLNLKKFEEILTKKIQEGIFDNINFTHHSFTDKDGNKRIAFQFEDGFISVNESYNEIAITVAELTNQHFRLIIQLQKIIQEVKKYAT